MYEALEASVKTSSSNRSKYFDLLTADEQNHVLLFVEYLETSTDFSKNSINSYKSYVTRAIVKIRANETLTNDEKSGVRKFIEFVKTLPVDDDETDDDES